MRFSSCFILINDDGLAFELENREGGNQFWLASELILLDEDSWQFGKETEYKTDVLAGLDDILVVVAEELRSLVADGVGINSCARQLYPFVVDGRTSDIADVYLLQVHAVDDLFEVDVGSVHGQPRTQRNSVDRLLLLLHSLADVVVRFMLWLGSEAADVTFVFQGTMLLHGGYLWGRLVVGR